MCCLRKSPFNRKNVRKLLKHPFVRAFEQSSILDVNDVSDLEFDYLDSYPSPTDGKACYEPKQAKRNLNKHNLEVKERKRIFKKKDYGELKQSFKNQMESLRRRDESEQKKLSGKASDHINFEDSEKSNTIKKGSSFM